MTEKQKLLSNINVSVFLLLRPRAVSAIHYDVKPASLPDFFIYFLLRFCLRVQTGLICVNNSTVDFEWEKSKSHAACASSVSFTD